MAGYTRQSTFADGDTITAALFNNEYNQLVNAFSNTSGHAHDGTAANGPVIGLIGDAGETTPLNKILIDTANNYIEFYVDVSSSSVQQLYIADGAIIPVTDNDIDLGTSSLEFKDLYLDGTATIDTLTVDEAATIGTTLGVTGATTLSSTLGVTGATTLSSTLGVTGATTLSSTLAVTGTSTLTGNVTTTNDLSVGGNLTVTGNATISGNLTFGDADTDSITLTADVASNITPDTDDTYDLGTATKQWRNLYIDGTAEVDTLSIDGTAVTSTAAELNILDGVTATAAEINTLDGITATVAELNILDGVTSTATELNIVDGDTAATATTLADADRVVVNDAGVMKQVALTDFETYFEGALDTLSNVTTVGALNAGSITSGFGAIDNGSSNITTTGTVTYGSLSDGVITITAFADEDDMVSNSATLVPTQQSVKAYVDSQVTAQDLDLTTDSGTIAIDLDSETLTVAGGTGIDTSASANSVTVAIDSTVATLTDTQTLTNKTLTSPDINTPDIDGGTIDSTVIGGTTPAAGTFTTLTANTSIAGTLTTAAQTNITSVGTLSSLTVSGDATFDTDTLYVDSTNNRVGIGISSPADKLHIVADSLTDDDDTIILGANFTTATTLASIGTHHTDANNGGLKFSSKNAGTLTEYMRIANDGNVGIGTDSPSSLLHLYADNPQILLDDLGTQSTIIGQSGNILYKTSATVRSHVFYGLNTEVARITGNGNVGIGVTNPGDFDADAERLVLAQGGADVGITLDCDTTAKGSIFFADGATGDNLKRGQIIYNHSGDVMSFATNAEERMRIDSSGNVGIRQNNPVSLLHLGDGTNSLGTTAGNQLSVLRLQSHTTNVDSLLFTTERLADGTNWTTSAHRIQRTVDATKMGYMQFGSNTSDLVTFGEGGTEYVRIDGSGNVGIGTSSPDEKLHVHASDSGNSLAAFTNSTTGLTTEFVVGINSSEEAVLNNENNTDMFFATNDTERMRITSDGNVEFKNGDAITFLDGISYNTSANKTVTIGASNRSAVNNGDLFAYLMNVSGAATGQDLFIKAKRKVDASTEDERQIFQYDASAESQIFFTADTERMRIDSSGRVGIGTSDIEETVTIAKHDGGDGTILGLRSDSSFSQFEIKTSNSQLDWGLSAVGGRSLTFDTNSEERMRIDSSGNVGIGTDSPSTPLHISNGSPTITLTDSDAAGINSIIAGSSGRLTFDADTDAYGTGEIFFKQSGAERMRIDSSGNVGIGTSDPEEKLHVDGAIYQGSSGANGARSYYVGSASIAASTTTDIVTFNGGANFYAGYKLTLFSTDTASPAGLEIVTLQVVHQAASGSVSRKAIAVVEQTSAYAAGTGNLSYSLVESGDDVILRVTESDGDARGIHVFVDKEFHGANRYGGAVII